MNAPLRVVLTLALALAPATAFAKAKGKTQIVLQVKPPKAELFIDGHPKGKATAGKAIDVAPGTHTVKLVLKGDEHEERIKFAAGEQTTYSYEFDEAVPTDKNAGDLDAPTTPDAP